MAREIAADASVALAPPTDLRELAFLLSRAAVVVAGDTGPLHLAAAFETPTVGLYGPTDPRRNGPWGQIESCLERFTIDRSLESISVDQVFESLESCLEASPQTEVLAARMASPG
jgi:ADP-heptose:LPS heptosyltransferase